MNCQFLSGLIHNRRLLPVHIYLKGQSGSRKRKAGVTILRFKSVTMQCHWLSVKCIALLLKDPEVSQTFWYHWCKFLWCKVTCFKFRPINLGKSSAIMGPLVGILFQHEDKWKPSMESTKYWWPLFFSVNQIRESWFSKVMAELGKKTF